MRVKHGLGDIGKHYLKPSSVFGNYIIFARVCFVFVFRGELSTTLEGVESVPELVMHVKFGQL